MTTVTKWVVFNPATAKRIKTVTLKHPDNLLYKQLNPFEQELKKNKLAAQRKESLDQDFLIGKSFKEKLICLGWEL